MELGFRWDERREGEIENDENVLEGLQPHTDLKKLSIREFKGRRFSAWAMKMAVQNVPAGGSWIGLNKLTDIELGWCTECKEIPMLGHLPNLKSLKLEGLSNVKRINSSGIFPDLERLVLRDMPKLAQVEFDCGSDDVQVFPSLRSLEINKCPQLMSVETHSLSCLKYLSIGSLGSSMPAANLLFETKYGLLAELTLVGIDDLECLPDWLFRENPNLLKISISECPKLRELPPGLLTLTSSLQTLYIADCPLLGRITCDDCGEESQSVGLGSNFFFTSLRCIYIKRCNALVWLPRELVGPSLEELWLECLSSLENVRNLMDECMARSPRLNSLTVISVPKLMDTSGWHFGSLRSLDVNASDVEGGILQGCHHSLRELTVRGTGECDGRVPESIQRLTGLCELTLMNFGMEELPEWLGNLSSLRVLFIYLIAES